MHCAQQLTQCSFHSESMHETRLHCFETAEHRPSVLASRNEKACNSAHSPRLAGSVVQVMSKSTI